MIFILLLLAILALAAYFGSTAPHVTAYHSIEATRLHVDGHWLYTR